MSDELTLRMEQFLASLCPTTNVNMPPAEREQLITHMDAVHKRADQNEATAMRATISNQRLAVENVNLRRVLMMVASHVPEDDGPFELPKELANGLRSIFEEATIAKAAADLSGGVGGQPRPVTGNGFVYWHPVRCEVSTDKAIQVQDLVTTESFWVPKSQVESDSEVKAFMDEGTLVVSKFIAKERGWMR
jgi:hypothetical protein